MVLKEAYRYQKFLDRMLNEALSYLSNGSNIKETKREHMRTKVNPNAVDETEVLEKSYKFTTDKITPNDIINFVMHIGKEKNKLTIAIAEAKKSAEIDIDASIMNNQIIQKIAATFKAIGNVKAGEKFTTGYDYKFNEAGDQVRYSYNVKETTTIDFNRNMVKAFEKKLYKASDEASTKIDMLNVTINVDYDAPYDVNDSFEDCVLTFIG